MVFSSLTFLFFFFPVVLIGYILIKPQAANAWLFVASLFFYYVGAKEHLLLLLEIIILAYVSGIVISLANGKRAKLIIMYIAVGLMVTVMSYYKYWDFLIININLLFKRNLPSQNMILPIGISFFVFQAISYVVDVYRGEDCLRSPVDMGLYISFFPQLIAGPIVRFHDIKNYLSCEYRRCDLLSLSNGIWRFSIGICKKVLFANNLGGLADIVFGVRDISGFSVMYAWLGGVAYALQIYFDFSGYSDMAIGLGKIFGFEFQENFHYPYVAVSVKEFWKRWHISLSQFFRDYVYIPLGGNKCSRFRWIFNMMLVWTITGIWHGASWNYIVWGTMYGCIIIMETIFRKKNKANKIGKIIGHGYTLIIIIVLWVVFRANSISQAVLYLKTMMGINTKNFIDHGFVYQFRNYFVIIILAIIFATPFAEWIERKYGNRIWYEIISVFSMFIGFIVSISYIYMGSYNPFLYFMF